MTRLFSIVISCLLVGCSSSHIPGDTIYEMSCEIVLTSEHPTNDTIEARLVNIADDGATTIKVLPSGPELRATVGDYFISEAYGRHGLQLISASAEKHEAKLLRRTAEYR